VDYNPYILVPFATWAIAQISKFALAAFKGKIDFRYLYSSGGMPSVHSAVVCSLAMTAFLVSGPKSPFFGFAAIFAAIVMYDSFGVRRASGEQAAAINMLIESLDRGRIKLAEPRLRLREILGHQPDEVTVGAIVGLALGALFNYSRLGWFGGWLQTVPSRHELIVYTAAFVVILLGGVVARLIMRARYPKSKTMRRLGRRLVVMTQTIGWLGLLSSVFIYERASYLAWRLWPVLILTLGLLWAVWLFVVSYRNVPAGLAEEATQARKLKWLQWGKRKRKTAS
jgi:uncharacterized protein